ncbi:MAG: YicC family protein [Rhodospirillales bacterium]|nr:YicC family protein [Rhodospirillales bacterium]
MTLSSMTGFGRAEGQDENCAWAWELRSVNGKGLDVRCRLPAGFESLEQPARERTAAALKRGNVSLTLNVERTAQAGSVRVNTAVLEEILALLPQVEARLANPAPSSADRLLALRGVVEVADEMPAGESRKALDAALLGGLERALASLAAMRGQEGARLAPVLAAHLEAIAHLCARAEALASTQPAMILERLRQQVAALGEAVPALPEERLAQELAMLALKADAREELDRLQAHVQAVSHLLAGEEGAVGRRLDFLCQEFNREANTLCSKSADVELTAVGVELKAVIEQFREQVQNIE